MQKILSFVQAGLWTVLPRDVNSGQSAMEPMMLYSDIFFCTASSCTLLLSTPLHCALPHSTLLNPVDLRLLSSLFLHARRLRYFFAWADFNLLHTTLLLSSPGRSIRRSAIYPTPLYERRRPFTILGPFLIFDSYSAPLYFALLSSLLFLLHHFHPRRFGLKLLATSLLQHRSSAFRFVWLYSNNFSSILQLTCLYATFRYFTILATHYSIYLILCHFTFCIRLLLGAIPLHSAFGLHTVELLVYFMPMSVHVISVQCLWVCAHMNMNSTGTPPQPLCAQMSQCVCPSDEPVLGAQRDQKGTLW